jgi:hypothetical protein
VTSKKENMMYSNKLAVALKSNGKILREFKDTVYIPFGSEYSILVKNLDSVRAIVNIFLDGENVVPGGLVVNGKQEIDLERWIKNGNLKDGNRFKFIERTAGIEQHRGIKLEDGLIRVEFQFEKRAQSIQLDPMYWKTTQTPFINDNYILRGLGGSTSIGGASGSLGDTWGQANASYSSAEASIAKSTIVNQVNVSAQLSASATSATRSLNDVGITVPGSKSDQKFSTASWFLTESETHTMILKILGETADCKPVLAPVTVKAKPKCTTCGKLNKATAKFCSECGTALELF